jgi:chemotaxis protein CheX
MNVEYISPFLNAISSVIGEMLGLGFTRNQVTLKHGYKKAKEVTVKIGVVGHLNGFVFIGMEKESAMLMASTMMCGMPVSQLPTA